MKIERQQTRQSCSQDLLNDLLEFLRQKYYAGHAVNFVKDRKNLLKWVVLWPASWLIKKGVTLPEARYKQIFTAVFLEALQFQTAKVTYLPAYLRQVIQSHFDHHGDEIYEEAKSMRNLTDHVMLMAGKSPRSAAPDPVADLARANSLLTAKKRVIKSAASNQPDLL